MLPFARNGGWTKISVMIDMKTIIEKEPERCISTPVTGTEADAGRSESEEVCQNLNEEKGGISPPSKSEEVCQNLNEEKGGISPPSNEDEAGPDIFASGAAVSGEENEELEWARRHVPPDPYVAERKTEIIGWGVKPRHKVKQKPSGTSPEEEEEEA